MVEYYNLDMVLWDLIKKAKKKGGFELVDLGLRLREFKINEDYEWVLYVGDKSERQDDFENVWKNRLVILNKNHSTLSDEALQIEIASQFKKRINRLRKDDYLLSYFSEFLGRNNE